jgi:catechol 2,3-dioxygenase-like lactoylglutathione lyase family enzyme
LDVTDPDKSVAFYEKLFGLVTQRSNDRTWFQVGKSRIGLLAVATGRPPGVNHFCVSAAAFKYDAVMKRLEQAGARLEAPEVAGAPEFRDPDGILVQVMSSRPAA